MKRKHEHPQDGTLNYNIMSMRSTIPEIGALSKCMPEEMGCNLSNEVLLKK